MTDLDARADRVREITKATFGDVLEGSMIVAIPADASMRARGLFAMAGIGPVIHVGQETKLAPRRVADMA
jgi:hypothetical protein